MIPQLEFQFINYDAGRLIESSSSRSNGDSNRLSPAGVSLPHDKGE
jgi:hypothetical protein